MSIRSSLICAWMLTFAATACSADLGPESSSAKPTGPFAGAVVSFSPGDSAGFGQAKLPGVVLGPPHGGGDSAGGLDVVSLGKGGEIVLELTDITLVDGPGADLLVFENAFANWVETGVVAASEDGKSWYEWPCNPTDKAASYPGCAGVGAVHSHPDNPIDPTDPDQAGGDRFDLADIGLAGARFVRIKDSGQNVYEGIGGGFDLDAIAVVNGTKPP